MKKALPANGKIAKDAKETVQECVSEFISFITSENTCWMNGFLQMEDDLKDRQRLLMALLKEDGMQPGPNSQVHSAQGMAYGNSQVNAYDGSYAKDRVKIRSSSFCLRWVDLKNIFYVYILCCNLCIMVDLL
ncbi:hypothetical protein HAX54_026855 [Datura stramonium]|uniref:Transcription factor CBF/NF-Y/archaeal histone domain-containing protein n=1 Tax=Datura stramonium TaxID=4076 RepID=A0ABS8V4S5_DATST|nr:hypothetical protein [Datura stramonium]